MKKYFLDIHKKSFFNLYRNNASAKPRTDAVKIAKKCGIIDKIFFCTPFPLKYIENTHPGFKDRLLRYKMWNFVTHTKNSVIFVQIPFLHVYMHSALKKIKDNGNKIIILIHDIEAIRGLYSGENDLQTLKLADIFIVHTNQMKEKIIELGYMQPCYILRFFDYLNDYVENVAINTNCPKIIYAGGLGIKSSFIWKLYNIVDIKKIQFYIYGKGDKFNTIGNVVYKGFFDSENIENVEGDWGLVWDGDDIATCSNSFGNYLTYNAPFKFSLYLAIGKPVIVWKNSAMSAYVNKYHLGICVESLNEIYDRISNLSTAEIKEIENGVKVMSKKVKNGDMLFSIYSQICELF